MNALTRSELVKLRSTRMLAWLVAATVTMQLVTVVANIPSTSSTNNVVSLDDPALLARIVGITVLWSQLTIALLGVLAYTQEDRYATITSTFLVEPRRHRVLAAKGAALVLASAVIAAVTLLITIIASVALIRTRHGSTTFGIEFWQVVVAAFVVLALSGVIGLSIGGLLRNQIVAVIVTLVWLTAGEHLLLEALPQVARWTPVGATSGLLQLGAEATTRTTLLTPAIGGLLLTAYTAGAAAIALVVAPRRDVL